MIRLPHSGPIAAALVSLAVLVARPAHAADPTPTLSLELDPLAYALRGYGLLAAYQPNGLVRFTAGGFKVGKLPDFITNDGNNKNWEQGLYGAALWVNFFTNPSHRGLAFGALFERRYHTYTNTESPGEEFKQTRTDLIPAVSYLWFPFKRGLYVLPWTGVAIPLSKRSDIVVGGKKYEPRKVDYFITAHVGYEF